MCGIIGIVGNVEGAALRVHAGLSFLQHRGQDATGIATMEGSRVFIDKGYGLAEDVFDAQRLAYMPGDVGIGHVRYSTAGSSGALSEVQPFYVNQPYGMMLAHNGNLTNTRELRQWLTTEARRHIGTDSDSEILLNVLAHATGERGRNHESAVADLLFDAVTQVHESCLGSYSAVVLIAGVGLLAFRDPNGIRPLVLGWDDSNQWIIASESVVCRPLGFRHVRDIAPGEAVFIDQRRALYRRQCAKNPVLTPCMFEYIYLARPDTTMDGISVYAARLNMGRYLAEKIRRDYAGMRIDCVVPVPDSGRVAAMEAAHTLGVPYREGLVKNRHIGRTFISAGQMRRHREVRKKLNAVEAEFAGKSVMLVDDSVVRGTTARQLVSLARAAGAERVYFASAAPPIKYPNVYGIDIPTRAELLAGYRNEAGVASYLGADKVIYQSLDDLKDAVRQVNDSVKDFETSCFDGKYPVGVIDESYLKYLGGIRCANRDDNFAQGNLALTS